MNAFPFTNCITQPIYFITLSLPPPLILAPWTLLSPSVFYPSLPFPQFLPSPFLPFPFPSLYLYPPSHFVIYSLF